MKWIFTRTRQLAKCDGCKHDIDLRRSHVADVMHLERLTWLGFKVLSSTVHRRRHLGCVAQGQTFDEWSDEIEELVAGQKGYPQAVPRFANHPGQTFHAFADNLQRTRALEPDVPTWGEGTSDSDGTIGSKWPGKDDGIR